ncbi:unnamed protein product [Fusarium venenatum]|uniref:Chromo domain-containing protein n=1 Tax=Fusarium venenatum TaxID=56646 RepID=A0A2L2TFL4_9HYPO|nr:uncharacterized protein FVRRES_06242 [Fusarium venenatum]CEI61806.1 unnamed protein product [Fusarium venenatum]
MANRKPRPYMPYSGVNDNDVEITSHYINRVDHIVYMWVTWCNGSRGMRCSEYDVQTVKPNKVYEYWRKLGGRCSTTELSMYHVFDIIGECGRSYHVQWIGYDEDEATWESKAKVKRICPRAVLDWQQQAVSTLAKVN